MTTKTNHAAAATRIADKRRRAEKAAVDQAIAGLDPEYVSKLRHDALRSAHERLPGATPEEVTAEAAKDFESRVRFLIGK
jgi:hypothetical protein